MKALAPEVLTRLDVTDKRVVVVGLGSSGLAAAELCADAGASVLGLDARADEAAPEATRRVARERGIELAWGPHERSAFDGAELVVLSPGVPPLALLDEVEAAGVPVIGEMELAARGVLAPIIAVGGTNGKSTTTKLIHAMLSATGKRVFVGANFGEPSARALYDDYDWVVFEVSSFQLERAPRFKPRVSLLLNVSEDHLDRYPDFAAYVQAKGNAFVNQDAGDIAVVPATDEVCLAQAKRGRARLITFGDEGDYRVEAGFIVARGSELRLPLSAVDLHGRHNHDNLAAAVAALHACGFDEGVLRRGLAEFTPLAHRMQRVAHIDGVSYYDDSKGTNVGASVTAIAGLSEPRCVLIAGGKDKHGSYEPLVAALAARGRGLVLIGEAAERIAAAARGVLPVRRASTMADAVAAARELAESGDAVLLSPACSSFDMFSGYAERGRAFAEAVNSLSEKRES